MTSSRDAGAFASATHRATTIACALFVAVVLGRWAATSGLWCDELLFLRALEAGPWSGILLQGSSHPPLVRWLLAPFVDARSSDVALRAVSVASSVACVFVWSAFLRRVFDDRVLATLLLPVCCLNAAWAAVAYELVPYGFLTLCASLHAWSWFRVVERPSTSNAILFVASAVAAAWSHFFATALVVATLAIGHLVALEAEERVRIVLRRSAIAIALLTAAMTPAFVFYAHAEAPYPIVQVGDRWDHVMRASRQLFDAGVAFRLWTPRPTWIALHVAIGALFVYAWRERSSIRTQGSRSNALKAGVIAATCASGLPALQLYALATDRPIFERYMASTGWATWPAIVLALGLVPGTKRALGGRLPRVAALAALLLGAALFATGRGACRIDVQDWTPVVRAIAERARPGDAFVAQDVDQWSGDAQFDRLWLERYAPNALPVAHPPWTSRTELFRRGLELDALDASVHRAFVFSHLFTRAQLEALPRERATEWELVEVVPFEGESAMAIFARR